ncbi:hypothetical protein [Arcicella rosea]|uniref:Uncharacterized protein n=1 Tax=Arcicella rosea TaxID=502909 RepID=A0A841EQZ0_9BACT|nr:hypothetical protein [Arcicella rosea]MBB6003789.1 hypothetical protein [Arcicella rosea]
MPAKKEYLSTSGQRVLKASAGILGGLFLSVAIHLLLGILFKNKVAVMLTGTFTAFLLWAALLAIAFLAKNGWKIWGIYLVGILICSSIIYLIR